MNYLLLIMILALAALLFIRLRLKLEYSPDNKKLFFELGRFGPRLNLFDNQLLIKLADFIVERIVLNNKRKAKSKRNKPAKKAPVKKTKIEVRRSWSDLATKLPAIIRATGPFFKSLIRGVSIERLDGEIQAGFEHPDLTGQVYGCYQAVLGMAPGITRRFNYYPDWSGASFAGSFNFTAAVSLYSLLFSFLRLFIQLPLRELWKFTIGRMKGA